MLKKLIVVALLSSAAFIGAQTTHRENRSARVDQHGNHFDGVPGLQQHISKNGVPTDYPPAGSQLHHRNSQ